MKEYSTNNVTPELTTAEDKLSDLKWGQYFIDREQKKKKKLYSFSRQPNRA